jgi:hypothetical protein
MNFTTLVEAGSIQQIFSQYRRLTSSADLRWKIENSSLTDWSAKKFTAKKLDSSYSLGPYRQDAIWQHDANFQFSMTFNFNIFQCFSNIRNHLSNFSYLVCISCKIFTRWRFYLFLKTENSRHIAESRPICVGLFTCRFARTSSPSGKRHSSDCHSTFC